MFFFIVLGITFFNSNQLKCITPNMSDMASLRIHKGKGEEKGTKKELGAVSTRIQEVKKRFEKHYFLL